MGTDPFFSRATKSSTCSDGGRDVLGARERKGSLRLLMPGRPKPRPRIGATYGLLDLSRAVDRIARPGGKKPVVFWLDPVTLGPVTGIFSVWSLSSVWLLQRRSVSATRSILALMHSSEVSSKSHRIWSISMSASSIHWLVIQWIDERRSSSRIRESLSKGRWENWRLSVSGEGSTVSGIASLLLNSSVPACSIEMSAERLSFSESTDPSSVLCNWS